MDIMVVSMSKCKKRKQNYVHIYSYAHMFAGMSSVSTHIFRH